MTLVQITDGTSNTIAVGEKGLAQYRYTNNTGASWDDPAFCSWGGSARAGWWIVQDPPASTGDNGAVDNNWGAPFTSGCPFVFYDGSVRFLNFTQVATYAGNPVTPYLTHNGGEVLTTW